MNQTKLELSGSAACLPSGSGLLRLNTQGHDWLLEGFLSLPRAREGLWIRYYQFPILRMQLLG